MWTVIPAFKQHNAQENEYGSLVDDAKGRVSSRPSIFLFPSPKEGGERKRGRRAKCANAKHDSKLKNKGIVEGEVGDKGIVEECEDRLLVHDLDIRASAVRSSSTLVDSLGVHRAFELCRQGRSLSANSSRCMSPVSQFIAPSQPVESCSSTAALPASLAR